MSRPTTTRNSRLVEPDGETAQRVDPMIESGLPRTIEIGVSLRSADGGAPRRLTTHAAVQAALSASNKGVRPPGFFRVDALLS